MDEQIIQDIVAEVFSSLEPLDAQSAAILQFLKAKGLATDEELAPFLAQAGNAANVRWLAARVRIASLLTSALKTAEKPAEPRNEEKRDDKEKKQEGNSDQTLKADSEKQWRQENLQAQDQGAREKQQARGDANEADNKQVNDKAEKQEQPQNSRQSQFEGRGENAAQSSPEQSNSSAASSKKDAA